jgi:hypothetical protein
MNSFDSTMPGVWLPPELWKQVFSLATAFAGEFDVRSWISRKQQETTFSAELIDLQIARINIAGADSNQFLLLQNPEFYDQIKLRRTLIFVCKDWFEMCLEHLYGSILIYDASTLAGCIDTLKRFNSLAKNVRRLEIKLDNLDADEEVEITSRRQLVELVKMCPNLLIFYGEVEESEGRVSEALAIARLPLRAVLSTHCKSIRHAMGQHVVDGYPARTFFRNISAFTNLIALQLPSGLGTMAAAERPTITLPSLRILDLGYQAPLISPEFSRYLSWWILPALDAVHLGTLSPSMALQRFWASHGSKLKTIRIYNARESVFGRRSVDINLGITAASNELFPNLRQLLILHNAPSSLIRLFLPSSSLEIYEVPMHGSWRANDPLARHLESQVESHHMASLLHPYTHMTPNLHTVRISKCPRMSDRSERGLRCNGLLDSSFPGWEEELLERNVKLEKLYDDE